MKSLIIALYLLTCSVGSALGIAISPTSKDPQIAIQFACLTGVMFVVSVGFYLVFNKYDGKEEELNKLETNLKEDNEMRAMEERTAEVEAREHMLGTKEPTGLPPPES